MMASLAAAAELLPLGCPRGRANESRSGRYCTAKAGFARAAAGWDSGAIA